LHGVRNHNLNPVAARPFVYVAAAAFNANHVNNAFGNNKTRITVYVGLVKNVVSWEAGCFSHVHV